jgi:hypothetical protein
MEVELSGADQGKAAGANADNVSAGNSESEQTRQRIEVIKRRATAFVHDDIQHGIDPGIDLIRQIWENDTWPADRRLISSIWGLTDVSQPFYRNNFKEHLREEATELNIPVETVEEAITAYRQLAEAKKKKADERIAAKSVENVYSAEQIELLVRVVEADDRIRGWAKTTAEKTQQYAREHNLSLPLPPEVVINSLLAAGCPKFANDFGQAVWMTIQADTPREAADRMREWSDYCVSTSEPLSRRLALLEESGETARTVTVEGFGAETGLVEGALAVWMPAPMSRFLQRIERHDPLASEETESMSRQLKPEYAKQVYAAGKYTPDGKIELYTPGIGKLDPSEMWMFIHEAAHADLLSLLAQTEMLADYLAIIPDEENSLTDYVRNIEVGVEPWKFVGPELARQTTLISKYTERYSELIVLALTDPEDLRNRSERLSAWAERYLTVRTGRGFDEEGIEKRWSYIHLINAGIEADLAVKLASARPESLSDGEVALLLASVEVAEQRITKGQERRRIPAEGTAQERQDLKQEYWDWARLAGIAARVISIREHRPVSFGVAMNTLFYNEDYKEVSGSGEPVWTTEPSMMHDVFMALMDNGSVLVNEESQDAAGNYLNQRNYPTFLAPGVTVSYRNQYREPLSLMFHTRVPQSSTVGLEVRYPPYTDKYSSGAHHALNSYFYTNNFRE